MITTDQNYLTPTSFNLTIKRIPNVTYSCHAVSLPSVSLGSAQAPNMFNNMNTPGSKIEFSPLIIRFNVGEDLTNYLELFNWMIALAPVEDLQDKYDYIQQPRNNQLVKQRELLSDVTLTTLTNAKNPVCHFNFVDMYPSDLTTIDFDSKLQDIQPLTTDATFTFRYFTVNRAI